MEERQQPSQSEAGDKEDEVVVDLPQIDQEQAQFPINLSIRTSSQNETTAAATLFDQNTYAIKQEEEERQKTSSKRKKAKSSSNTNTSQPSQLYKHYLGRQNLPNSIITEGILSSRSNKQQRAVTPANRANVSTAFELQSHNEQEMHFRQEKDRQLIMTTQIHVKKQQDYNGSLYQQHQQQYVPIDHSALFVQNSPRQQQSQLQPVFPNNVQQRVLKLTQQLPKKNQNMKGTTLGQQGQQDQVETIIPDDEIVVNPLPVYYQQQNAAKNQKRNGNTARLGSQVVQKRSNGFHKKQLRKEQNESQKLEDRSSTRTGTYTDFMRTSKMGSQKFNPTESQLKKNITPRLQANSQVGGGFFNKQTTGEILQGSIIMTQNDANQSSSYSVGGRQEPMVTSNSTMKVTIEGKNTWRGQGNNSINKRHSEVNSQIMYKRAPMSGFESVSVHDAKLDILSQQNTEVLYDKGMHPMSKTTNPFNVRSFQTHVIQPRKSSTKGLLMQHIQASETESQKQNPTKVEVFKVYDLIRNHKNGRPSPLRQSIMPSKTTTPKVSETFIKQIMKEPRMTNYQQLLKRPKTNHEKTQRISDKDISPKNRGDQTPNGFRLESERDLSQDGHFLQGVISSDNAVQINSGQKVDGTYYRNQIKGGQTDLKFYDNQTEIGDSKNNQTKRRGGQLRLNSQGTKLRHPIMSNSTTPTAASKRFAGGFGGAGSVFTHSHLIQKRKHSQLRIKNDGTTILKKQNWPINITAVEKTKFISHQALNQQQPIKECSDSFLVSGNRAKMQEYFNEPISKNNDQATLPALEAIGRKQAHSPKVDNLLSNDTSRSPIPIDPEIYKNMHNFLPKKMDASTHDLASRSQQETYHNQSRSISSNERKNEAEIKMLQQMQGLPKQSFIMSPHGLQKTLQLQQELANVGHSIEQANSPSQRGEGKGFARKISTQHGKRSKNRQLNVTTTINQQEFLIQGAHSVDTANNTATANQLRNSTESQDNSSHIINLQEYPSKRSFTQAKISSKQQSSVEDTQVNSTKKMAQNAKDIDENQDQTSDQSNYSQVKDKVSSDSSSSGQEPKSEQNVSFDKKQKSNEDSVNELNMFNHTSAKQTQNIGSALDSGEQMILSGLTNARSTSNASSQIANRRQFKPVLNTKSYLMNNDLENLQSDAEKLNGEKRIISLDKKPSTQSPSNQTKSSHHFVSGEMASQLKQTNSYQQPEEHKHNKLRMEKQISATNKQQSEFESATTPTIGTSPQGKMQPNYARPSGFTIFEDYNAMDDTIKSRNSIEYIEEIPPDQNLNKKSKVAKFSKKDFGSLNFVESQIEKNDKFIEMQKQLLSLDYNTKYSEQTFTVEKKIDIMMKAIALQSGLNYSQMASEKDVKKLFDTNQRRTMHINSEVPLKMIKFKTLSEQNRYTRIAQCIVALNDSNMPKSQNDVEITYMKVFRFLADILTSEEFESLSYYHVSRFIGNVLLSSFDHDQSSNKLHLSPVNLRQFVCQGLDLLYKRTEQSQDLVARAQFNMKISQSKQLWSTPSDMQRLDLNETKITEMTKIIPNERSKVPTQIKHLDKNPEARHQQIQDKITQQAKSFANEPSLNAVMLSTYFKGKETYKSKNLSRLNKDDKQLGDLNHANLVKESTIARNKIVLEHVVAARNMREWKDQILTEIHKESQQRSKDDSVLTSKTSQKFKTEQQRQQRRNNNFSSQRIY